MDDGRGRLGMIAGQAAGKQFMEQNPDRENVGTMADGLGSINDFGRGVVGGAKNFLAFRDIPSDRVGETEITDFRVGVEV